MLLAGFQEHRGDADVGEPVAGSLESGSSSRDEKFGAGIRYNVAWQLKLLELELSKLRTAPNRSNAWKLVIYILESVSKEPCTIPSSIWVLGLQECKATLETIKEFNVRSDTALLSGSEFETFESMRSFLRLCVTLVTSAQHGEIPSNHIDTVLSLLKQSGTVVYKNFLLPLIDLVLIESNKDAFWENVDKIDVALLKWWTEFHSLLCALWNSQLRSTFGRWSPRRAWATVIGQLIEPCLMPLIGGCETLLFAARRHNNDVLETSFFFAVIESFLKTLISTEISALSGLTDYSSTGGVTYVDPLATQLATFVNSQNRFPFSHSFSFSEPALAKEPSLLRFTYGAASHSFPKRDTLNDDAAMHCCAMGCIQLMPHTVSMLLVQSQPGPSQHLDNTALILSFLDLLYRHVYGARAAIDLQVKCLESVSILLMSLRRFLLYTRNDSLSGLLDSMMGHFLTGAFAWIETSETPDEARPGWWRVVQEIMRLDVSCMDRHMKKFFHALSVEEKLIGAKQNSLIRGESLALLITLLTRASDAAAFFNGLEETCVEHPSLSLTCLRDSRVISAIGAITRTASVVQLQFLCGRVTELLKRFVVPDSCTSGGVSSTFSAKSIPEEGNTVALSLLAPVLSAFMRSTKVAEPLITSLLETAQHLDQFIDGLLKYEPRWTENDLLQFDEMYYSTLVALIHSEINVYFQLDSWLLPPTLLAHSTETANGVTETDLFRDPSTSCLVRGRLLRYVQWNARVFCRLVSNISQDKIDREQFSSLYCMWTDVIQAALQMQTLFSAYPSFFDDAALECRRESVCCLFRFIEHAVAHDACELLELSSAAFPFLLDAFSRDQRTSAAFLGNGNVRCSNPAKRSRVEKVAAETDDVTTEIQISTVLRAVVEQEVLRFLDCNPVSAKTAEGTDAFAVGNFYDSVHHDVNDRLETFLARCSLRMQRQTYEALTSFASSEVAVLSEVLIQKNAETTSLDNQRTARWKRLLPLLLVAMKNPRPLCSMETVERLLTFLVQLVTRQLLQDAADVFSDEKILELATAKSILEFLLKHTLVEDSSRFPAFVLQLLKTLAKLLRQCMSRALGCVDISPSAAAFLDLTILVTRWVVKHFRRSAYKCKKSAKILQRQCKPFLSIHVPSDSRRLSEHNPKEGSVSLEVDLTFTEGDLEDQSASIISLLNTALCLSEVRPSSCGTLHLDWDAINTIQLNSSTTTINSYFFGLMIFVLDIIAPSIVLKQKSTIYGKGKNIKTFLWDCASKKALSSDSHASSKAKCKFDDALLQFLGSSAVPSDVNAERIKKPAGILPSALISCLHCNFSNATHVAFRGAVDALLRVQTQDNSPWVRQLELHPTFSKIVHNVLEQTSHDVSRILPTHLSEFGDRADYSKFFDWIIRVCCSFFDSSLYQAEHQGATIDGVWHKLIASLGPNGIVQLAQLLWRYCIPSKATEHEFLDAVVAVPENRFLALLCALCFSTRNRTSVFRLIRPLCLPDANRCTKSSGLLNNCSRAITAFRSVVAFATLRLRQNALLFEPERQQRLSVPPDSSTERDRAQMLSYVTKNLIWVAEFSFTVQLAANIHEAAKLAIAPESSEDLWGKTMLFELLDLGSLGASQLSLFGSEIRSFLDALDSACRPAPAQASGNEIWAQDVVYIETGILILIDALTASTCHALHSALVLRRDICGDRSSASELLHRNLLKRSAQLEILLAHLLSAVPLCPTPESALQLVRQLTRFWTALYTSSSSSVPLRREAAHIVGAVLHLDFLMASTSSLSTTSTLFKEHLRLATSIVDTTPGDDGSYGDLCRSAELNCSFTPATEEQKWGLVQSSLLTYGLYPLFELMDESLARYIHARLKFDSARETFTSIYHKFQRRHSYHACQRRND